MSYFYRIWFLASFLFLSLGTASATLLLFLFLSFIFIEPLCFFDPLQLFLPNFFKALQFLLLSCLLFIPFHFSLKIFYFSLKVLHGCLSHFHLRLYLRQLILIFFQLHLFLVFAGTDHATFVFNGFLKLPMLTFHLVDFLAEFSSLLV